MNKDNNNNNNICNIWSLNIVLYAEVQFYSWFKFYFPLFLAIVMCGNVSETMGKN